METLYGGGDVLKGGTGKYICFIDAAASQIVEKSVEGRIPTMSRCPLMPRVAACPDQKMPRTTP